MTTRKKILIGMVEIADFNRKLCEGLKSRGLNYDFITYTPHSFGYGGETRSPVLVRWASAVSNLRSNVSKNIAVQSFFLLFEMFFRSLWALNAIVRYDVFIFSFGKSLLPGNLDLPILKLLSKTVISNIALGSESRPAYINGATFSKDGVPPKPKTLRRSASKAKKMVTRHQKYATYVVGAPFSTSHFSSSPFINWFSLGFPSNYSEQPSTSNDGARADLDLERKSTRILHSPSHPAMKGTERIREVINRLKNKGYDIDFIEIHGRRFSEVLKEIQMCDFVVDQVFSDTPLAGFAKESAWFAKPAVVGGYGLRALKGLVEDDMWPPSAICHPDDLEVEIERLIVDIKYRKSLGQRACDFVTTKWHTEQVASRYLRMINRDVPKSWWFDPRSIVYLEGAGQTIERTRCVIHKLIEQYGIESLKLSHRPDLEIAFERFAQSKTAADESEL